MMGAGKSALGKPLAELLSCAYYDLDAQIEEQEARSISLLFEEKGEAYFRKKESDRLQFLCTKDAFVLSCGGGTPCFNDNMKLMNKTGITIWLNPPVAALAERLIEGLASRPLLKGLTQATLPLYLQALLEERKPYYALAQAQITASHPTPESVAELISGMYHPSKYRSI